jgi:hypothetical protein
MRRFRAGEVGGIGGGAEGVFGDQGTPRRHGGEERFVFRGVDDVQAAAQDGDGPSATARAPRWAAASIPRASR